MFNIKFNQKNKLRVFEGFSGIGSQRMSLENIGVPHEVVAISEIDKFAIKSYMAIHGETLNLGDISKIDISDIPDHDLFTYSFPCQDVSLDGSLGGMKEDSNTRSSLLWDCKRIIEGKKPKYLLLENVTSLVNKRHKPDFDKWLLWLESQGYANYTEILNSIDFGIPQNRKRVFVVSILNDDSGFEFTKSRNTLVPRLIDFMDYDVDESYYLTKERFEKLTVREETVDLSDCQEYKFLIRNATTRGYLEANVGDGISMTHIASKTRRGRVQKQSVPTLQSKEPIGVVDNKGIRRLTPNEYWRLMGISDEYFKKAESVTSNKQLYKQAGNSIVVDVLEDIFKNMFID